MADEVRRDAPGGPSYALLVSAACEVREQSYSPYSGFRVGAALLGADGRVYVGTNVENASFGLTLCAERNAVARAVADGETRFEAIAICADGKPPTPPCGACRQVLVEFGRDLTVLLAGERGAAGPVRRFRLSELLPEAFTAIPGCPRAPEGETDR
ncbi:MAG: cytidine deaminase [Candidatus Krumholzibacteriia bacterium]